MRNSYLDGKILVRQHLLRSFSALTYLLVQLSLRHLTVHTRTCLGGPIKNSAILSVSFLFVVAVSVLLVDHLTQLLFITAERRRGTEALLARLHRPSLHLRVLRDVHGSSLSLSLSVQFPHLHLRIFGLSQPLDVVKVPSKVGLKVVATLHLLLNDHESLLG